MAKSRKAWKEASQPEEALKGWQTIADFLGQPISVVERWAKSGMAVAHQGRRVVASTRALNQWLEREPGGPIRLATADNDLSSALKRSVSQARH
jgi:hypothetical protein